MAPVMPIQYSTDRYKHRTEMTNADVYRTKSTVVHLARRGDRVSQYNFRVRTYQNLPALKVGTPHVRVEFENDDNKTNEENNLKNESCLQKKSDAEIALPRIVGLNADAP
jgi:hypothetical protein